MSIERVHAPNEPYESAACRSIVGDMKQLAQLLDGCNDSGTNGLMRIIPIADVGKLCWHSYPHDMWVRAVQQRMPGRPMGVEVDCNFTKHNDQYVLAEGDSRIPLSICAPNSDGTDYYYFAVHQSKSGEFVPLPHGDCMLAPDDLEAYSSFTATMLDRALTQFEN